MCPRVLPLRFLDCYHNTQDIIPRPLGARGGASVSAYTASFCSILSFTVHIALVRQRLHQITGCFVLFNKDLYMNSLKTGSPVLTLEFFYSMLLSIDFIGSVFLSNVYCSLAACSCLTCPSAATTSLWDAPFPWCSSGFNKRQPPRKFSDYSQ